MGLELFRERVVGANPGCVTCHSLDDGITLVGPSLYGIESRVDGLDTGAYIRQSILEPDAYVVDGFLAGQMSPSWGDYLSAEQIESLVEFLTNLS
jgi:mono/diheme cytochrome c family protein